MLEPADRDAVFVHEAIKKHKIEYQVLIEISCTRSPEELFAIRRAYQVRYKLSLEEDVACHTSGDIRKASYFRILIPSLHFDFAQDIIKNGHAHV